MTPEQRIILEQDLGLHPWQLDLKYNPEGYGQHPVLTRADWRDAVYYEATLRGYWEWVSQMIEEELNED